MSNFICITGAKIISGDDCNILENAALVIENGLIRSISTAPCNLPSRDLGGRLLCPMFIDAHTHLSDTGAKELGLGLSGEKRFRSADSHAQRFYTQVEPEILIQMMRNSLREMLRNGIIACSDFCEQGLPGIELLKQAARGLPIQVRILGKLKEKTGSPALQDEARRILEACDGVGIHQIESHPEQYLYELKQRNPEKIFAWQVDETSQATRKSLALTGKSEARRAADCGADLLVHMVHTPEEDAAYAANRGISAVACVRSSAILGEGVAPLKSWAEKGLVFSLGTDHCMVAPPEMMGEMQAAAQAACGQSQTAGAIDSRTLFKAGTINAARALRLDNRLGSLAPGKEGSFIAFDLRSPNLAYSRDLIGSIVTRATPADIDQVFIKGKYISEWF